jgi:hypothetical protein
MFQSFMNYGRIIAPAAKRAIRKLVTGRCHRNAGFIRQPGEPRAESEFGAPAKKLAENSGF